MADSRLPLQDIKDPKNRPAEGIYKQLIIRISRILRLIQGAKLRICRILRIVLQRVYMNN